MQLNKDNRYYISPEISKKVLRSIISNEKIEFKSLGIENHKTTIKNLVKNYNSKKKNDHNKFIKNSFFWDLVSKKYKNYLQINFKKKNQNNKEKYNVNYQEISKSLGYNPTLISLIIFERQIKKILQKNNFFKDLESQINLENIDIYQKINLLNSLKNKEINIFTPLCPDYEHIKISENLYKYTFNSLGDGYGLIGKKYINASLKIAALFKKHNIKYKNHIYYGDFEGYSNLNCKKVGETEISFMNKVRKSSKKIKKRCKPSSCGLIVEDLSTKEKWLNFCSKNRKRIVSLYKKDKFFKKKVLEICVSRKNLYSSWFPDKQVEDYLNIVFDQGAEYTSLSDLVGKKFKNPIFICFDHSKMKIFYNINNSIPVLYSKPLYL